MKARAKGLSTVLAAALMGGTGAGLVALAPAASATTGVSAHRLAGANRYATAAAVAEAAFPSGSDYAVVVSGQKFPDAMSAGYLAGQRNAPVLLTGQASLPADTLSALKTLKVRHVFVVGGTAAVSQAVITALQNDGFTTQTIGGVNRDVTAQDVAELFPSAKVGALGSQGRTAILARDNAFPDSLTGAPVAYTQHFPILLTPSGTLSSAAATGLTDLGIQHVIILGGTNAISTGVVGKLEAMSITVQRLSGPNREATATAVANFELGTLGYQDTSVTLARGDNFPDALAGGPYAGVKKSPIVLTASPSTLSSPTQAFLKAHSSTISGIEVLGGTSAVSDSTVAAAVAAAK